MSEGLENEPSGWDESAAAWIAEIGDSGDFGRRWVLDGPMLNHIRGRGFSRALDVGCGEGRFCRMMQAEGIATVGIDPTAALVHRARSLDPDGDYRIAYGESFEVEENVFDLVVCYLTLVDIDDLNGAINNICRALRPGGTFLVANLTSFNTAGIAEGWRNCGGIDHFPIDRYLEQRSIWVEWRGIRIRNWHRPLETYMQAFLNAGFLLRGFSEPSPTGGDPEKMERYRRVPYFHVMEWQKAAS
jgi:SAM-dependent methyltransferase